MDTRTLYAATLALAASAGFSAGWALRPPVKVALSEEERMVAPYEEAYRLDEAERGEVRAIVRRALADLDALRRDFDSKYGAQVQALTDRYDAELRALLPASKKR